MKINNKGFTLVELLAVLAILITILLVAIPSITSSLSRSEQKELDAKKELIISSVEISINKNASYYSSLISGNCKFSIDSLINNGWITEDMAKDNNGNRIVGCIGYAPSTGIDIDGNGIIENDEKNKYYFTENCPEANLCTIN